MNAASLPPVRLGEVLLQAGLISGDQLEECLALQLAMPPDGPGRLLGAIAVERGFVTGLQVALAISGRLDIPIVDLSVMTIPRELLTRVPRSVALRAGAVAYAESDGRLSVAMVDPTNVVMVDDVRAYTGVKAIDVAVAPADQIERILNQIWLHGEDTVAAVSAVEGIHPQRDSEELAAVVVEAAEAPIVRLVNLILGNAVRVRASDIHLEPQQQGLRVRYRVDGLLRDVMQVPQAGSAALVSRVKIMSGLDISERRRPQDGRARLDVDDHAVDARVSTLPTMHGEKVVIRLLQTDHDVQPLVRSGLSPQQLETLMGQLVAPQGLVLITGPTGSGKTSTLYGAIHQLRTADRNVVTLEDPVEIQMAGINQVQINDRAGITFARGLRAVLRQDPDVILVGEIRDAETAELAMQAALTGHLVFATVHANDAASALTRLVDIGVDPSLIASSLALVVAQRLVRIPCASCVAPYEPSDRTLNLLGITDAVARASQFVRGTGCGECGDTGYLGRTGIFEVLPIDGNVREVLTHTHSEAALRSATRDAGVASLRAEGVARARLAQTTLDEVLRTTQPDSTVGGSCGTCLRPVADDMVACPWCATPIERHACSACARPLGRDWQICPWCQAPHHRLAGSSAPAGDAEEPLRRPALLVIDDDPSVGGFVRAALSDWADVRVALTAGEGLRICAADAVDLVVLDMGLPDLSGVEVTRLLRADTRTALLPLLALTGSEDPQHRAAAAHAGVDDYLRKPVEPLLLEHRVRQLLETAGAPPEVLSTT